MIATSVLFETADVARDPEGLITKFVQFEASRHCRHDTAIELNGALGDRLETLVWYLSDYGAERRDHVVPLSAGQIAFLNRPAPIAGMSAAVTVAFHNFVRREKPDWGDFDDTSVLSEALYWWCIERTPGARLDGHLVTIEQVDLLRQNATAPGAAFGLNRFMVHFFERHSELHALDMDTARDRAALLSYLVLYSFVHPHILKYLPQQSLRRLMEEKGNEPCSLDQVLARHCFRGKSRGDLAAARDLRGLGEALLRSEALALEHPSKMLPASTSVGECLLTAAPPIGPLEPGIAVIGPLLKSSGLGRAVRLSIDILAACERVAPTTYDFDLDNPSPVNAASKSGMRPYKAKREINLINLNAESIPLFYAYAPSDIVSESYNIGYFFWELNTIPESHRLALELLDEVWVSSAYNREVYARATDKPVVAVGMAIDLPTDIAALPRSRFFVDDDSFVFLTTFDSFSFIERKNPLGVLAAFRLAFPLGTEKVRLVLKTHNRSRVDDPYQRRIWARIDAAVRDDPRISAIDETYTYRDLLGLKRACDCYVSLHRSEGWGFGLIEAMHLGLPVIATGYSGNMEFCRPDTAFLVDYELVGVREAEYQAAPRGSHWAEPSIATAADQMKRVMHDKAEVTKICKAAAALVRDRLQRSGHRQEVCPEARRDPILQTAPQDGIVKSLFGKIRQRPIFDGRSPTPPQPAALSGHGEPANAVGYFDKIQAGSIVGWAATRADLDAAVKVRLYLDETLCAEGIASGHRADVEDAGYGNGRHGFELTVPKKALICAERITLVVVADDGVETRCDTRELRQPVTRQVPVLYMDASDLIEFLTHHRELSGIQRVQAGFLLGLGNATIAGTQCRICTRFKSSSFYFEVPYDGFAALLGAAGDRGIVSEGGWKAYVGAFKTGLTSRANLARGDTIFTMGAPWALDDHNETIRCAKEFYGARYIQIFYDLIPISVPEVVAAPLIPHFARAMAAMSIYADHVFSISRYSQDDLAATLTRLGRPVPEISVIPMGGSITDAEATGAAPVGTLAKLGVDGPFVLCVGTLEPRKNHMLLFQVWRRLVAKHGADKVPKLVLVGRVGWYMDDFMRMLKITGFVEKTVIHLQGVSNAELSELYKGCLFTTFPSFSEGWGLPITESLALGKVCVCSNSTSMPEAGGTHALYVDPFDTSAAYDLCETLIYDGETLAREEAKLRATFKAPTWSEASDGLRAQFADLLPRLAARPAKQERKPIELGRNYKFYNIEAASPDATALKVFDNFLDQEDALDLLVGWNWFEVDVGCTWACGSEAALELVMPAGVEGPFDAYVGLVVPDAWDGGACRMTINGLELGTWRVKHGPLTLNVPLRADVRNHSFKLQLLGTKVFSNETRLLGFGLANIVVYNRNEINMRVKVLRMGSVEMVPSDSSLTI